MKKFLLLLFMVAICSVANHAQSIYGDVNGDGAVNVNDVTVVYNVLLGNLPIMTQYTVNGVTFKMVQVQGGTFMMGATSEQSNYANYDEYPVHQVTLSSFFIGETEVTQELWQAVMGSNPSYNTGNLLRPVENVSWNDCQIFITKLNTLTGQNFRLPTEAEWEYAARGGFKSHGYIYSGSDNFNDVAWYSTSSSHPVATKAPNELGLYDMSGNVEEWCFDWYGSYSGEPQINPVGPNSGPNRVDRGGSYISGYYDCRVSRRDNGVSPSGTLSSADPDLGLRLAMSIEE